MRLTDRLVSVRPAHPRVAETTNRVPGRVVRVTDTGGSGNGGQDESAVLQRAADIAIQRGATLVVDGVYRVDSTVVIQGELIGMEFPQGSKILNNTGGTALRLNPDTSGDIQDLDIRGLYVENLKAHTGPMVEILGPSTQILLDRPILHSALFDADVGLRIENPNNATLIDPKIIGRGDTIGPSTWFAVGLLIEHTQNANNGNVTVLAGDISRATVCVDLRNTAGGLFNNFAFFGMKLRNNPGVQAGSYGIRTGAGSGRIDGLRCDAMHIEDIEAGIELDGVRGAVITMPQLSWETSGAAGQVGIDLVSGISACRRVVIVAPVFKNGTTGVRLSADAHDRVLVVHPTQTGGITTLIDDQSTGVGVHLIYDDEFRIGDKLTVGDVVRLLAESGQVQGGAASGDTQMDVDCTGGNGGPVRINRGGVVGSTRDIMQVCEHGTDTRRMGVESGGALFIEDGIAAPGATAGRAKFYIDEADGDLKIIYGDGVVKTIVTDT